MIVTVEQVMRNAADQVDLSDITTKTVTRRGWVRTPDGRDVFEVQFAVNLTQAESDEITLRLSTTDANQEVTEARAWQAADTLRQIRDSGNDTILSPLVLSRGLRLLARVALYLLRLQLRRTDAVEAEPGTTTTTTTTGTQTAIQTGKKT